MPKLEGFPKVSLRKSLNLADVVHSLGSACSSLACAQKLNVTLSGGFNTKVSACVKFGLLIHKKGHLSITTLYSKIKFSKTPEIRNDYLSQSFFSIDLYKNVIFELKKQRFLSKDGINSYLSENELIHVSKIELVSSNIMDDIKFLHLMESSDIVSSSSISNITRSDSHNEDFGKQLDPVQAMDDVTYLPSGEKYVPLNSMSMSSTHSDNTKKDSVDSSLFGTGDSSQTDANSVVQSDGPKKSAFWSAKLVKEASVGEGVYVHIKGKGIHFEGQMNHASDISMLEGMLTYLKRRL